MCGIFALLNNNENILTRQFMMQQFEKGKSRGPENSIYKNVMIKADFGFHRLAINGLNDKSNQPIIIHDIALICNGEIYNYKQLYRNIDVEGETDSDCEIIIHLYLKYGIDHTLQMLDGVFSFILIDYRLSNTDAKLYVARDPYGVRPLYILSQDDDPKLSKKKHVNSSDLMSKLSNKQYVFASELKVLYDIYIKLNDTQKQDEHASLYTIKQFLPGTYSTFRLRFNVMPKWKMIKHQQIYHTMGFNTNMSYGINSSMDIIYKNIRTLLIESVEKRCITTDRPIACLLSGGLDSSLVCALVNNYHKKNNLSKLETYSIGLQDSEDLKYARIVADYLGTNHHEVLVTEQDFIDAIPEVIYTIESYDTTTVRASIGNWLLGKYIAEHSEAKVIFNGDGADELMGGYLYMNYAEDSIEFDRETRRLLKDIHLFDVLRSDKCISSHGLEPRTPFLDRTWVQYYMTLPMDLRFHKRSGLMEKIIVRTAFMNYSNIDGKRILPENILMRKKEAFSDGVSKTSRSLYEILNEFAEEEFMKDDVKLLPHIMGRQDKYETTCKYHPDIYNPRDHLLPKTAEQFYYRKVFESHYKGMGEILPYFWMPKYIEATDASARTLPIYTSSL